MASQVTFRSIVSEVVLKVFVEPSDFNSAVFEGSEALYQLLDLYKALRLPENAVVSLFLEFDRSHDAETMPMENYFDFCNLKCGLSPAIEIRVLYSDGMDDQLEICSKEIMDNLERLLDFLTERITIAVSKNFN